MVVGIVGNCLSAKPDFSPHDFVRRFIAEQRGPPRGDRGWIWVSCTRFRMPVLHLASNPQPALPVRTFARRASTVANPLLLGADRRPGSALAMACASSG